ncbi:hypothetical protein BKA62DRAFT_675280 [Auriculariales sp. MPI-PUGE-AT-0066]|nr:hypothetical protein BKA62DRAFT_675280 [Auriculariales sp. MPI-PUGE-AT-0066]
MPEIMKRRLLSIQAAYSVHPFTRSAALRSTKLAPSKEVTEISRLRTLDCVRADNQEVDATSAAIFITQKRQSTLLFAATHFVWWQTLVAWVESPVQLCASCTDLWADENAERRHGREEEEMSLGGCLSRAVDMFDTEGKLLVSLLLATELIFTGSGRAGSPLVAIRIGFAASRVETGEILSAAHLDTLMLPAYLSFVIARSFEARTREGGGVLGPKEDVRPEGQPSLGHLRAHEPAIRRETIRPVVVATTLPVSAPILGYLRLARSTQPSAGPYTRDLASSSPAAVGALAGTRRGVTPAKAGARRVLVPGWSVFVQAWRLMSSRWTFAWWRAISPYNSLILTVSGM